MVSEASGIFRELNRDIGVVEILQALAGLVVGQEEVPQAYFLGLVLGLLQHRELFRRKAPAIVLVLAEPHELDRHRVDGLADEFLDVLVQRTDLVRHAQIVEFFARIEIVGRRSRDIGVFHGLFPPICARTSILRARARLVGRQCRRRGGACTSAGERAAIFRLMASRGWCPDIGELRSRCAHLRRAFCSNAPSTASVMAVTPVSMVGFGTGANKGEWLDGSGGPSPSRAAATRSGS